MKSAGWKITYSDGVVIRVYPPDGTREAATGIARERRGVASYALWITDTRPCDGRSYPNAL